MAFDPRSLIQRTFTNPVNNEKVSANVSPFGVSIASLIDKQVSGSTIIQKALAASGIRNVPTDTATVLHSGVVDFAGTITDNVATSVRLADPASTTNPFILQGNSAGSDKVKNQVMIIHRARAEFGTNTETGAIYQSHRALAYLKTAYGQGYGGALKTRIETLKVDLLNPANVGWTVFDDPVVVYLADDTLTAEFGQVDSTANIPILVELDVDIFAWDKGGTRPIFPYLNGCGGNDGPSFTLNGKGGSFMAKLQQGDYASMLSGIRQGIRGSVLVGRGR